MAELIRTNCPKCGGLIQVPDSPGALVVCPLCQQRFAVGEARGAAQTPAPTQPPAPPPPMMPPPPGALFPDPALDVSGERITPVMADHLRSTRPWVLFLSILSFIFCALGLIGLLASTFGGGPRGAGPPKMFVCVNVLLLALYFIPAYFLFTYASTIRVFVESGSGTAMEAALGAQKSFWKFVGILTAVSLVIMLAFFLVLVSIGASLSGPPFP